MLLLRRELEPRELVASKRADSTSLTNRFPRDCPLTTCKPFAGLMKIC